MIKVKKETEQLELKKERNDVNEREEKRRLDSSGGTPAGCLQLHEEGRTAFCSYSKITAFKTKTPYLNGV